MMPVYLNTYTRLIMNDTLPACYPSPRYFDNAVQAFITRTMFNSVTFIRQPFRPHTLLSISSGCSEIQRWCRLPWNIERLWRQSILF